MARFCPGLAEQAAAAQALDFRKPSKSSKIVEDILSDYRKEVPFIDNDTVMHFELQRTVDYISL